MLQTFFLFKAEESICEELQAGYVCKRRLEHLKEHTNSSQWCKKRLDRMLVEYFLRRGYYNAASRLAQASDLRDLTNIGTIRHAVLKLFFLMFKSFVNSEYL